MIGIYLYVDARMHYKLKSFSPLKFQECSFSQY